MTRPSRSRGRPPLSEGERPRRRMVHLPPDLDEAAAKIKGPLGWSEWLRRLVQRTVSDARRATDSE